MKIGKACDTYSAQSNRLLQQRQELTRQQKELSDDPNKKEELDFVTVQLNEVNEKYNYTRDFMDKLSELKSALENAESTKQQGEAMADAYADMAKCMEVARRIANGHKVPSKDVEKLMEYNPELYMQALNAAAMSKNQDKKEYESLWEDEEGNSSQDVSIEDKVNNMECGIDIPEIVTTAPVSVE